MSDQFGLSGIVGGRVKPKLSEALRPLPTIDRARQVTSALAHYVADASLKTGDRLPAERELMAALAVGRSTIREAIRHFQALGVIETRKGSGTYLLRPISPDTVHMPLSLDTTQLRDVLLQTLQVRRGIECEAGMVAARMRTKDDLAIIEAKLVSRCVKVSSISGRRPSIARILPGARFRFTARCSTPSPRKIPRAHGARH
jgi:DNA-binding FadR family transcriptional regulator